MSQILYHPGEEHDITISYDGLYECIVLARGFGWKPMGTVDPSDDPQLGWDPEWGAWPGYYCRNHNQMVKEDDARAFSKALFRGLEMIAGKQLTPEDWEALKKNCPKSSDESFLSLVREVAEFAAEGSFRIC